jgi:hypothetical protein
MKSVKEVADAVVRFLYFRRIKELKAGHVPGSKWVKPLNKARNPYELLGILFKIERS